MPDERLRVLVVDDDVQVAHTIARLLRAVYDVTVADSVHAAQQAIRGATFDLVVSDVMMPVLTGVDLYEWVLARSPGLAACVVFVTGGTSDPTLGAALARLPNHCVAKPFTAKELRGVVDAVAARVTSARRGSPS